MRTSKQVTKFDSDGHSVATYESLNKAAQANGMSNSSMYYYIYNDRSCNGFKFSLNGQLIARPERNPDEMPWERNGFFDVKGWAKTCL